MSGYYQAGYFSPDSVPDLVRRIVNDNISPRIIPDCPDTSLRRFKIEPVELLGIGLCIEDRFDITIPDRLLSFSELTLQDLIDFVYRARRK